MEGMTLRESSQRKAQAARNAMFFNGFNRIA
jgi:hypothetical protein